MIYTCIFQVSDKPKLDKKITLNESFTARKRQMSLYSGLNKSFQKVKILSLL